MQRCLRQGLAPEAEMAAHSSIVSWRIPWTEEPSGLWSIGSQRVGQDWSNFIYTLEKTLESPLDCKQIQPVHPKGNQYWIFIGRTDAEAERPILWPPDENSLEKTLMLGEIESRRRGGDRGWDGWMASPIQWIWVWANSGSWWWTGTPFMLQFMESQRVGLNWSELMEISLPSFVILFWTLAFNWCQGYHSHGAHLHSKGCNQKRSKYN